MKVDKRLKEDKKDEKVAPDKELKETQSKKENQEIQKMDSTVVNDFDSVVPLKRHVKSLQIKSSAVNKLPIFKKKSSGMVSPFKSHDSPLKQLSS